MNKIEKKLHLLLSFSANCVCLKVAMEKKDVERVSFPQSLRHAIHKRPNAKKLIHHSINTNLMQNVFFKKKREIFLQNEKIKLNIKIPRCEDLPKKDALLLKSWSFLNFWFSFSSQCFSNNEKFNVESMSQWMKCVWQFTV